MDDRYKKVAVAAVKKAGAILEREYGNFDRKNINLKSHHEIVTRADLLSEEIILQAIRAEFPAHQILSEEHGEIGVKSDYLWLVDPIDGTTNFSIHNPLWSISVALAQKGEIVLGIIYAPWLQELYLAEKNKGAYLNNKKMRVSKVKDGKIINAFCHGSADREVKRAIKYYSKQKLNRLDCRQMGSAAIELAYTAVGRIESIVIPGANLWDVAAGILMVREAGGRVTDFSGREWNMESKDMAASNGIVHAELTRVLKNI